MYYGVSLHFESVHNDCPSEGAIWEERIVVIEAADEAQARLLAESLGKAEEVEYTSASGDRVRWVFRCVAGIFQIEPETLGHGTEVFSRHLRAAEAKSLQATLRASASVEA